MRSILRSRAAVVSVGIVGIVMISSIGGATAATLITSKQIKDGTVASVDVKDGTLQPADLSAAVRAALQKQGPAGVKGEVGPVGPVGPIGPAGPAGEMGMAGPKGDIGPIGPVGAAGEKGAAGPEGEAGPVGAIGPVGPAGEKGVAGPEGEAGAIGPVGPAGERGASGPQGEVGPAGPTGPRGADGAMGPQGPAGISNVTAVSIPAGGVVTPRGTFLAQVTLNSQYNYVVTAGVTATTDVNDSMQCQLLSTRSESWDDLGEATITARATVPLEHAYPRSNAFGTYTAYVACVSGSRDYVVDTGHLYAWQVGSVSNGGSHVISQSKAPQFFWEPMD